MIENLTFIVPSRVVDTKVDRETVILQLDSGIYHGLDESGTLIWEWLKEGQTPAQIAKLLVDTFDISEPEAREDTLHFVGDLVENKLVESR